MKRVDLLLIALVFLLLLAVSHKHLARQRVDEPRRSASSLAQTSINSKNNDCTSESRFDAVRLLHCASQRRVARLGFDASRDWFDRESHAVAHAHRNAFQRLVSAERALRRERLLRSGGDAIGAGAPLEAWALLLDGDDAAQHYTNAALAHVRALRAMQQRSRDVLLLLNEAAFDDVATLRFECGAGRARAD